LQCGFKRRSQKPKSRSERSRMNEGAALVESY